MRRRSHVSRPTATGWILRPAAVRRLGVGPGDGLRFVIGPDGVRLERAFPTDEDPLGTCTEWGGTFDDEDFADL